MSQEEENAVVAEETAAPEEQPQENIMESITHGPDDPVVSPKTLLDAGCHYGHKASRWNPKMRKYIYGKKNNLHIIDLNKTAEQIQIAYKALENIVSKGGKVLFVGTKPYAQKAIQDNAVRSGSFYVNHRWLGGTLTNFRTILKRISLLKDIELRELNGELDNLPKKEAAEQIKLKNKLSANLCGIKEIRTLPNALVVIDPKTEHNAVAEARALHIPVFALGDTNTDPDEIDYIIPANDDSEASISLIVGLLADAVVEGKGGNPLYAYKDSEEVASMADLLKSVDPNDQLRAIRLKLRDDAIAQRRAGKSGKSPKRKTVKKDYRRPANSRPQREPRENNAPAENQAAPAAEAAAPAAEAPAKEENN